MPAATASRKRKQTEEMEVSPPKRVTRARSAKSNDDPAPTAQKARSRSTKASTTVKQSTKPAARITKAPPPAPAPAPAAPKRATRSRDPEEHATEPIESDASEVELPKTRGRPKKTENMAQDESKKVEAPKTRGRAAKTTSTKAPASKTANTAPPRTRTRAATIENESEDELMGVDNDVAKTDRSSARAAPPPTKTARGKTVAGARSTTTNIKVTAPSTRSAATTRATGATAATAAKTAAAKKKVMFAEGTQDKENVPVRGKETSKTKIEEKSVSAGIRGKPTRRAAATANDTTASRTRSTAANKTSAEKAAPLSPKKVKQVAKGNSSSSEDELGSQSPGRLMARSPMRPPQSARKELPLSHASVSSPTKANAPEPVSPLLSRSPIRAPQSTRRELPFASPSKAAADLDQASLSRGAALSGSLLMSPAKRQGVPSSRSEEPQAGLAPAKPVMQLLSSPAKRVPLDGPKLMQGQPQQDAVEKASLLQSPPRRPQLPLGSMTAVPKEKKLAFTFGNDDKAVPDQVQVFNFSAATPRRPFHHFEAPAKVEHGAALNKMDGEDQSEHFKSCDLQECDDDVNDNVDVDVDGIASPDNVIAELDFDDTVIVSPSRPGVEGHEEAAEEQPEPYVEPTSTTPPGSPSESESTRPNASKTSHTLFRDDLAYDSEDELSETSSFRASNNSISTPTPALKSKLLLSSSHQARHSSVEATSDLDMTPLAHQFSSWPTAAQANEASGMSLTALPAKMAESDTLRSQQSPNKPSYFDDEMLVRSSTDEMEITGGGVDTGNSVDVFEEAKTLSVTSVSSSGTSEYGDENALPVEPQLMDITIPMDTDFTMPLGLETTLPTADPLELNMTPTQNRAGPREVMTVSKVPLKPSDESKNRRSMRNRTKSLAPVTSGDDEDTVMASIELSLSPGPQPSGTLTPARTSAARLSMLATPNADETLMNLTTPFKTPRVGADAQILRGAVIFVDVHTTEGADASGIFVDLLTQMGARCVKKWSWNSRASSIGAKGETPGGSKVGITHVVFKDGGKRTLEKVCEASGLVSCVGVGWVLDCERENKWLDEADYTVDTSLVPRGGHNRRKSMEPTPLANVNGTLIPASNTPARSVSTPTFNMSPTKEFLTFSNNGSPAGDKTPTFGAATPTINFGGVDLAPPETPAVSNEQDWNMEGGDAAEAPTTPYFVSKGAQLVQATCPPKQQTGRMLFPVSGRIEDEPDEDVRRRLVLARRKSLQWAPKIGSPLRRE